MSLILGLIGMAWGALGYYTFSSLVGNHQAGVQDALLRLQEKVPGYMVPGVIVELEEMPLTPNGKMDRKGLPRPGKMESASRYVAPRTGVEEILADIWKEVCATNADEVGASLDALIAVLQTLRRDLDGGGAIDEVFGSANQWREALLSAKPSV